SHAPQPASRTDATVTPVTRAASRTIETIRETRIEERTSPIAPAALMREAFAADQPNHDMTERQVMYVEPVRARPNRRLASHSRSEASARRAQPVNAALRDPARAIHVTMGRIEVRATPPPAPSRPTRPAPPRLSLDDYLRGRSEGTR